MLIIIILMVLLMLVFGRSIQLIGLLALVGLLPALLELTFNVPLMYGSGEEVPLNCGLHVVPVVVVLPHHHQHHHPLLPLPIPQIQEILEPQTQDILEIQELQEILETLVTQDILEIQEILEPLETLETLVLILEVPILVLL